MALLRVRASLASLHGVLVQIFGYNTDWQLFTFNIFEGNHQVLNSSKKKIQNVKSLVFISVN